MKQLNFPPFLLADLQRVEQAILERAHSRSAVIAAAGQHLLNSGGKRLRAALVLLSACLGSYQFERVLHAATAVELIHAASLTHDDLVDEAERRRGIVAVHRRWDNGVALMVGDYLFALAAGEMAQAPDPRIISYFSHAVMQICEGELSPVTLLTPLDAALSQYYFKTGGKTASLFAAACKAGVASGGGSPEQIEAMGHFGYELGLAFQIVDDVLDFVGDPAHLGKPAGNDMRQGTITLPLIYAATSSDAERLTQALDSHNETELEWAIAEVQRFGVTPAQAAARQRVERAMHHLDGFADSPARQVLGDIAAFVREREA